MRRAIIILLWASLAACAQTAYTASASEGLALVESSVTARAATLSGHSVWLTWQDAVNPVGTQYNVYRAVGQCDGNAMFALIGAALSVMGYSDSAVLNGFRYCYGMTAVSGGLESILSATVEALIPLKQSAQPAARSVIVK